jgi:hypothetical protein
MIISIDDIVPLPNTMVSDYLLVMNRISNEIIAIILLM